VTLLETTFILEANLSVEIVSSRCFTSGQTLAIITVLQLPPIESLRIFVNLLCLYGIWCLDFSLRATTTYSRKDKDLFIN